ncbi:beta-propeller fold lactonase family protein [Thermospira aquatica]|uniref:Beta-propeller fold lactonase family protein n=1 Tax=Thermospira aquatica TaxID=2828656 RepID=A0AAX3BDP9_9SPIR|nr:beta-propeller fold lactonase family protein [Thermospira aquatica]URA10399.1 beta-propeller fold lactonase family protein [Thermospira aquatica]
MNIWRLGWWLVFVLKGIALALPLRVESVPEKAVVYLGEKKVGTTPFVTNLLPGTYTVSLEKSGYKTYITEISVPGKVWARLLSTNSHFCFVKRFATGHQPKDVIFSPDDRYLYVSLLDAPKIQIYDCQNGDLRDVFIPEERRPYRGLVEGVFTPDGSEYWFTQMHTDGRIFVLDTKSFQIKTNFASHGNWTKVGEFTPDGSVYYVSHWLSHDVTYFAVSNYAYLGRVKTRGVSPRGVGFSLDGRYLYVVFYESGHIAKYDRFNNHKEVVFLYNGGGSNGRFRPDYVRGIAFINNLRRNHFVVYDLKNDTIVKRVQTWVHPNNLKLSPQNRYIYISTRGPDNPKGYLLRSPKNGRIQVFDSYKDYRLVEEFEVGNQPIGIAISSDHRLLAICNFMDDTVEIYTNESLRE